MKFPTNVIERLADRVLGELANASVGHCLRVDHLGSDLSRELNTAIRSRSVPDVAAFVLETEPSSDAAIDHERAVELRNRKIAKLVLFIPADLTGAEASSLENSFAAFDVDGAFRGVATELEQMIPEPTRSVVKRVRSQLTGMLRVSQEQWLDLLGHAVNAPETLGAELWRVGLIPDVAADPADLTERIAENARTVRTLAHPPRPQVALRDRLASAGVSAGDLRDGIAKSLDDARLRDRRSWTRQLSEEGLDFSRWEFEALQPTDLIDLEVTPFLKKDGTVESWSKLIQHGVGTQPYAEASGGQVVIRWKSTPKSPENVTRWQVELIPSEDAGDQLREVNELPSTDVAPSTNRATLKLDLDLDEVETPEVRVRVSPLDDLGREVTGDRGEPIAAYSAAFWLAQELDVAAPSGSISARKETVPGEAFGRLRLASRGSKNELETTTASWTHTPDDVTSTEPLFWTATIDRRHVLRVLASPLLNALEGRLREDGSAIALRGRVSTAGTVSPDTLERIDATALGEHEAGRALLKRRQDALAVLERHATRRFVATADWSGQLASKVRSYANAYRDALRTVGEPDAVAELLQLDTVQLTIEESATDVPVSLVAPSHPARMLWAAAHNDLLAVWTSELLAMPPSQRHASLDLTTIGRLEPTYLPAVLVDGRGVPLLHTQNLLTYWGVALPFDLKEPGRMMSVLSELVGLEGSDASLTDLPPTRVADEIRAYRRVHPYLSTLRMDAVTPGSGAYLADVLRGALKAQLEPDPTTPTEPLRVDVATYLEDPVPSATPELDRLANDVYEAQPRGRRSHLAPFFAYSHRPVGQLEEVAARDVHLTLLFDVLQPSVRVGTAPDGVDSSSFFGLLTRLVSSFSLDGRASWRHWLAFPEDVNREKHPAHGPYTTLLVDVQRRYVAAVARQLGGEGEENALALDATLDPEQIERLTAVHQASDWVMIVDRFLGIELYDAPKDPSRSHLARTYLIDHSPEFLDGIGHRLVVSTTQREEVEEILDRAMEDLGFSTLEDSVGQLLDQLKTVSGRLALRVAGDDARAREAVSLGVVVALLRARGELNDALLIPVDAHADVFGVAARDASLGPRRRCDLLLVRAHGQGLAATFVEVKARSGGSRSAELMHQMAEQMQATEAVFRDLFFRPAADARLDHVLQRARLASTLRFYADRAARHGLFTSDAEEARLRSAIGRLSVGVPELRADRHGYVINLAGTAQPPAQVDGATIDFISAEDFAAEGLELVRDDGRAPQGDVARLLRPSFEGVEVPGSRAEDATGRGLTLSDVDDQEAICEDGASEAPQDPTGWMPTQEPSESPADDGWGDAPSSAAESGTSGYVAGAAAPPRDAAIELGSIVGDQDPVTWRPSTKGSPHLFVLGIPGQGKSWTVTRLLQELAEQRVPAVVFDFHGQFAQADNPYRRTADPQIVDVAEGLPFSPFEADTRGGAGWRSDCFEVAEIFEYVCGLGDIQKDAVFEALVAAYKARGFGGSATPTLPTLEEVREQLELVEETKKVKNLISRTRPLLDLGLFREDVVETTDLLLSLERGLVFDVHAIRLETVQLAAGAFVLRKLYKDMFHWGEADRLRCVIVLDEAHRLAKDVTLPKIMKEGRKFGVGVVVASQGLNDFHPDVLGNAGTKVVFRTNHPSSRKVGGFLKGRPRTDLPEEIEQLSVGEALVQTPEMPFAEHVRMHPLDL